MEQGKIHIYRNTTNSSIILITGSYKPKELNPNALKYKAGNVNYLNKPAYGEE